MPAPIFRTPPQLPIAFCHTPESLFRITQEVVAASRKNFDRIAQLGEDAVDFERGVLPIAHQENELTNHGSLTGFYKYVAPERELKDASVAADRIWTAYAREVTMREDLFKIIDGVYVTQHDLDDESRHYLERKRTGLLRNGLGIRHRQSRNYFEVLQNRIDSLSLQCSRHIREDDSGLWFTPEELEGLPQTSLWRLRQGRTGTENEGKFWLSFNTVDLNFALTYVENPEIRKRIFIGSENRCHKNTPIVEEIIYLRAETAALLGFDHHVDFMTADRMMDSKSIESFLGNLSSQVSATAESERYLMSILKRADLEARGICHLKIDERIYLWDEKYYARLLKENNHYFNEARLAEYFPLENTLKELLKLVEEFFGIVFEEISAEWGAILMSEINELPSSFLWHPDVKVYAVYNEPAMNNEFLGYFYMDLLRRPGKCDHPCNVTFQAGFTTSTGQPHYPSTCLLTSFPPPTPTQPTLLRHHNLISLIHELGHGIHYLLGRTAYASTYGTSTSKDFVEIPSKLLENWAWEPTILSRLSRHYTYLPSPSPPTPPNSPPTPRPDEKAPPELLNKLIASRNFNAATATQKQLHLAVFDNIIHSRRIAPGDLGKLYNSLRRDITGLIGVEEGCGFARFEHLFIGYDAGYYCYSLAKSLATEIYAQKFVQDPLNGVEGRRYRRMVLEKGGGRPEREVLEEYLGRRLRFEGV
ncbi:Metalloproteases (zincins), catalytic [Glarea lozoyensis ATCC 20868]|uniref:Metalloproteases (Zincins), catalytic n=1 Tax=Glarea lozoyensis (strain ATCC 20868 / MF5171) TaxID=1116229 RepID=S3CDS5_GLAL2|nr:Metalloproteases (zincins), catalytic [Glarea lozoyensis ATCC 20868]EPE24672.1 Metalloproteases (zincins), catalytic [Glarea lozoyensis ATCC 20868]